MKENNNQPRPEWWLSYGWLAADYNNELDFYTQRPIRCGEPGEYYSEGKIYPINREDLPEELRNLTQEDDPVVVEVEIAVRIIKKN